MPARAVDTPDPEAQSMDISLRAQQNIEGIKKRRHGERQRIQTAFNGGVESLRARIHKQNKERAEQMKEQTAKVVRFVEAIQHRNATEKAMDKTAALLNNKCGKVMELLGKIYRYRGEKAQEASFALSTPAVDKGKGKAIGGG